VGHQLAAGRTRHRPRVFGLPHDYVTGALRQRRPLPLPLYKPRLAGRQGAAAAPASALMDAGQPMEKPGQRGHEGDAERFTD